MTLLSLFFSTRKIFMTLFFSQKKSLALFHPTKFRISNSVALAGYNRGSLQILLLNAFFGWEDWPCAPRVYSHPGAATAVSTPPAAVGHATEPRRSLICWAPKWWEHEFFQEFVGGDMIIWPCDIQFCWYIVLDVYLHIYIYTYIYNV